MMQESYYSSTEGGFAVLTRLFRWHLFKLMTSGSIGLFMRGGDTISISPQVNGVHEPELTRFIGHLADSGYSDYLIDIGSNIGLTSCQNGNSFKEVHMFELNPRLFGILESNCSIALPTKSYYINKYGLGDSQRDVKLTIPEHNWGGGFINDPGNSYPPEILAKKDGYKSIVEDNYSTVSAKIKSAEVEVGALFLRLREKGLISGVIKIDAEGYEPAIIEGILTSIPEDMATYIIFESWGGTRVAEVIASFSDRVTASILLQHTPYKKGWPKLMKIIALALGFGVTTKTTEITDSDYTGDVVLRVDKLTNRNADGRVERL